MKNNINIHFFYWNENVYLRGDERGIKKYLNVRYQYFALNFNYDKKKEL